jgi:hypothetical protein
MVVVFHDTQSKAANAEAMRENYVQYGQRLERSVADFAK